MSMWLSISLKSFFPCVRWKAGARDEGGSSALSSIRAPGEGAFAVGDGVQQEQPEPEEAFQCTSRCDRKNGEKETTSISPEGIILRCEIPHPGDMDKNTRE
jgi:hypothetical protein